jgi:hypothetical protein
MNKRFRRMADTDVKSIIADLDRWAAGQLGSKLTWAILEERSGFSRQSLQAKAEIKASYDYAKKSLSGGLVKSREQATQENDELQNEVQRLRLEIAEYKRRENLWRERWQRIAFHVRQKGIQIHDVDQPAEENILSEQETNNILRPFDKEIPSSGRI